MAAAFTVNENGDMTVGGALIVNGLLTPQGGMSGNTNTRALLVNDLNAAYPLLLERARRHDHPALALPEDSADDDLGIAAGAFGTNTAILTSWDVKAQNAVKTLYARWSFQLPVEYVAAGAASLKCSAWVSAVADVSATLDWEVFIHDGEGGVLGADVVDDVAVDINSATPADYTLDLDATALAAGVWLEIRLAVAIRDNAGGSPVVAYVGVPQLLLTVKG